MKMKKAESIISKIINLFWTFEVILLVYAFYKSGFNIIDALKLFAQLNVTFFNSLKEFLQHFITEGG